MNVYVVTQYWNNDEGYQEDLVKVFVSKDNAIKYLKNIKVSDILNRYQEKWSFDECGEIDFDKKINDDPSKPPIIASRWFHMVGPIVPPYEEYREMASYVFYVYEIKVEES